MIRNIDLLNFPSQNETRLKFFQTRVRIIFENHSSLWDHSFKTDDFDKKHIQVFPILFP